MSLFGRWGSQETWESLRVVLAYDSALNPHSRVLARPFSLMYFPWMMMSLISQLGLDTCNVTRGSSVLLASPELRKALFWNEEACGNTMLHVCGWRRVCTAVKRWMKLRVRRLGVGVIESLTWVNKIDSKKLECWWLQHHGNSILITNH
jgi:hypothetical protein